MLNQLPLFHPEQPSAWSVTDVNEYLREILESDHNLQDLWVAGEASNVTYARSGHLYFTLKDSGAALKCVMWRNAVMRQRFRIQEGDAIEVHGKVSVYEQSGQYQLYADTIRQTGEGELYRQFLRLKDQLEAEGLFEPAHKQPIPDRVMRIGVVTSPTGAALRDMINTVRRRYPLVELILAPTAVQGDTAPTGIVAAIQALNTFAQPDLIIVARGGGAIEDLWAFNDERVARAIFASNAPVITGVGHETDFTIADFVADVRAPTPTAAAEVATPDQSDLRQAIVSLVQEASVHTLAHINETRWTLSQLSQRARRQSPSVRVQNDKQRLDELTHRVQTVVAHKVKLENAHLKGVRQQVHALNPLTVLKRGYAIVSAADGRIIRSAQQVTPGEALTVRVQDGEFVVVANS